MEEEKTEGVATFGSSDTAKILGVSIRWLQKLTQDGVLEKEGHGKYEIAKTVQAFVAWKTAQAEESNEEELNFKKEKTLLTRAQRKKAEMELAVMRGELHRGQDVEQVMNEMLSTFRARCLVIPTRTAPLLTGKGLNEIKQLLRTEIREVLAELSEYNADSFYTPPTAGGVKGDESDEKDG